MATVQESYLSQRKWTAEMDKDSSMQGKEQQKQMLNFGFSVLCLIEQTFQDHFNIT